MMLYVILVFKLKLPSRHFSDEPENSSLLLPAPTPSTTPIPRTLYKRYRSDSKMTYFLAPPGCLRTPISKEFRPDFG